MVLRITVRESTIIVKAIQAAAVVESPLVIFIWRPEGICVQSMLTDNLGPAGQKLSTLLRLEAQTFSSYESTDQYFNAVVERVDLEAVFLTAHDDELIEFSRSDEDNQLNGLGYLHARFNRPIGAYNENYISLKIYGIFSESMLRSVDISVDPSFVPLLPMAAISAHTFADAIAVMECITRTVRIKTVRGGIVSFTPVGKELMPLILGHKNGVIYTWDDAHNQVALDIQLPFLNIHPGAKLSAVVFLYKPGKRCGIVVA